MKNTPHSRAKRNPIPVRFSDDESGVLEALQKSTSLSLSELIRRSVRFAVPKFQSGEVSPLDVPEIAAQPQTARP